MYFGCIADDFTGAADAASFLQAGGMNVVLINGVPGQSWDALGIGEMDAAVIALKCRSEKPEKAVEQVLRAAKWLKGAGAEKFYYKYCSTFDSTEKGNIGPVCDSLLEWSGQRFTVLCPSLPVNGRTVKHGILYVNGVPLEDSPMRLHPVNPMKKSRIKDLMEPQSKYPCCGAGKPDHYYLIPDYESEEDGDVIARLYGDLTVLTGGSGLCGALARYYTGKSHARKTDGEGDKREEGPEESIKKTLFLAGSCSQATRAQIKYYLEKGKAGLRIDPEELIGNPQTLDMAKRKIERMSKELLIYSADLSGDCKKNTGRSQEEKSAVLDWAFGELAEWAAACKIKVLAAAGGETSGAVTKKLGCRYFCIGKSITPGVPVLLPEHDSSMKLVLKSGNFGGEDFFIKVSEEMG